MCFAFFSFTLLEFQVVHHPDVQHSLNSADGYSFVRQRDTSAKFRNTDANVPLFHLFLLPK